MLNTARGLADQVHDWNQLGRYHQANEELQKQPGPKRVVFMGDSITEFWRLDRHLPGKPYVNRGIGGQTTPEMLVRMFPDLIDLKPAAMIVLARLRWRIPDSAAPVDRAARLSLSTTPIHTIGAVHWIIEQDRLYNPHSPCSLRIL